LLDADEFRRQGHQVIDFIADYYGRMDDYPVHPSVKPGFLRRAVSEPVQRVRPPGAQLRKGSRPRYMSYV
jgi:tyrosine decarboxylase